jgi:hypothetical protein
MDGIVILCAMVITNPNLKKELYTPLPFPFLTRNFVAHTQDPLGQAGITYVQLALV